MGTDIEIRVERVSQLFNMLDPYPFRERDLDPEAEAYIVDWASELPHGAPVRIVVHLPAVEAASPEAQGLPQAMRRYFIERQAAFGRELKELFRVGRVSLAIGVTVLALCLLLANIFGDRTFAKSLWGFAAEGLIIVGWVALWRPMEIFLYDWWPIARQRKLYRRLAEATVEVVRAGEAGP
ncbi:hypothetical protein K9U40_06130 [Xanthobacter autotrophicus]|nr:hypothetical protein [Xanthobacter autotrophicus]MDI4663906.1 hypothetical protein [Xanthobacter autotrophicus]